MSEGVTTYYRAIAIPSTAARPRGGDPGGVSAARAVLCVASGA